VLNCLVLGTQLSGTPRYPTGMVQTADVNVRGQKLKATMIEQNFTQTTCGTFSCQQGPCVEGQKWFSATCVPLMATGHHKHNCTASRRCSRRQHTLSLLSLWYNTQQTTCRPTCGRDASKQLRTHKAQATQACMQQPPLCRYTCHKHTAPACTGHTLCVCVVHTHIQCQSWQPKPLTTSPAPLLQAN